MNDYFTTFKLKELPVVCNIPHSSLEIPSKFRSDFVISEKEIKKEAFELADLFTDQLYEPLLKQCAGIISNVARIVVDIERFEDDELESMSKKGMGVVYTKDQNGKEMKKVTSERKQEYLDEIFRPYHQALTDLVEDCLAKHKKCIIVDCHSMPDIPRAYEPNQERPRPDICIGTDSFHTPRNMAKTFIDGFKKQGYSVKENNPFAGTLVPMKYYEKNKNVSSVLIEVNRKLYMDETKFVKRSDFLDVSEIITGIILKSVS